MAGWADLPCEFNRNRARAAADVEDALTGLRADARNQQFRDRRKQGVLHGLPVGPVPASGAVPECDLIGVAIMAGWRTDGAQFELVPDLVFLEGALASGFAAASLRTAPQGSTGFCSGILPSERR